MRWLLRSLLAAVAVVALYVGSAVVSLNGLVNAARAGNGTEILARTDMARLKRSLVDQIVSAYLIRTSQGRAVKPLERILANTYGASIADVMISKMLTAENLTNILQKGALTTDGNNQIVALTALDTSQLLGTLGRISIVKPVEFSFRIGDDEAAGAVNLHFEGDGWKLSGLSLPAKAVEKLAVSLSENSPSKG